VASSAWSTSAVDALSAFPLGPHAPSEVSDPSSAWAVALAVRREAALSTASNPKIARAAPCGSSATARRLRRAASFLPGLP
jgi:hypothetical protein